MTVPAGFPLGSLMGGPGSSEEQSKKKPRVFSPFCQGLLCVLHGFSTSPFLSGSLVVWFLGSGNPGFSLCPPAWGQQQLPAVPDLWVALPSAPWVSQPCLQHIQFPTLNPLCFKYLSMVSVFLVGRQLLYS